MHILANGAGRNLRSTIINHLNIRIMSTFVTWRTVENNGNSKSVSIARHTTRQAAMSYLEKIAKKYKTEVKFSSREQNSVVLLQYGRGTCKLVM